MTLKSIAATFAQSARSISSSSTVSPAGWSERLAPPIDRHRPDLVLHGHAHAGGLRGAIGDVPVYNVSVPVMQRDFWLFELAGAVTEERADVTLGTA